MSSRTILCSLTPQVRAANLVTLGAGSPSPGDRQPVRPGRQNSRCAIPRTAIGEGRRIVLRRRRRGRTAVFCSIATSTFSQPPDCRCHRQSQDPRKHSTGPGNMDQITTALLSSVGNAATRGQTSARRHRQRPTANPRGVDASRRFGCWALGADRHQRHSPSPTNVRSR